MPISAEPLNYSQLNDELVIERVVRDYFGEYSRNRAHFFNFLNMITAKKTVVRGKIIEHALHEEQTDVATVKTNVVGFSATANADKEITAWGNDGANNHSINFGQGVIYPPFQLIRIVGTGLDNAAKYVMVRLLSVNPVPADGYTCEIIAHNLNNETIDYTVGDADDDLSSHTCGVACPVDGTAPEGNFFTPKFVFNCLMRSRESITVGKHTIADNTLVDIAKLQQLFLKWFKIYSDIENMLLFSTEPWIEPSTARSQALVYGGALYYIRAHDADTQAVNLRGIQLTEEYRGNNYSIDLNSVTDASMFYNYLDQYIRYNMRFGSNSPRIFVASDDTISIFYEYFRDMISIERPDFGFMTSPSLWSLPTLKLPSGSLILMATGGLRDKRLAIDGDAFTALDDPARPVLTQAAASFGFCFDPEGLNQPVHIVNGVVQDFRAVPVMKANNDTFETVEIDGTTGFTMKDPRANGCLIFEYLRGN